MTHHFRAAVTASFAATFMLAALSAAEAKEIRLLATGAVQHTLEALAARFKAETGHEVKMSFGTAGAIVDKFVGGEPADIVVSSSGSLSQAAAKEKLGPEAPVVIGKVRVGLGVKAGSPAPDISTVEKLKAALLSAPSFSYADPGLGATTGIHFAKVLVTLGIADQVKPKAMLRNGGLNVMKEVAEGKASFGITQASEIKAVPGVSFSAYLPAEVQLTSAYAAAFSRATAELEAAKSFMAFITGPAGKQAFEADGFDAM